MISLDSTPHSYNKSSSSQKLYAWCQRQAAQCVGTSSATSFSRTTRCTISCARSTSRTTSSDCVSPVHEVRYGLDGIALRVETEQREPHEIVCPRDCQQRGHCGRGFLVSRGDAEFVDVHGFAAGPDFDVIENKPAKIHQGNRR